MSGNIFWALLLVLRLGLPGPAAAQQPAPTVQPGSSIATPPGSLTIFVLEGQNGVNDIRVPSTVMVVVEVRDEDAKPVEGADVVFELPAKVALIAGAGAAVAGIVIATRGSTPTVTLTPGRPTFGTP